MSKGFNQEIFNINIKYSFGEVFSIFKEILKLEGYI
jgi:hypothetical protein